MKKRTRNFTLLALCLTALTSIAVMTACELPAFGGGSGVSFVEEEKKSGPQFLEGALSEVHVNDTIVLAEYIEETTEDYTVKITNEAGEEEKILGGNWYPSTPGTYTLTYTIHSGKQKGTNTFTFYVTYPQISWLFTLQNEPYIVGQEMIFEEYFNKMNIFVDYAGPSYKVCMQSVTVDNEEINLEGKTSYTFNSISDHTFVFYVETSDGQRCEGREVISMKSIDQEYMDELTAMGISMEGELYVERDRLTMVKGSYQGGRNNGAVLTDSMRPHVLPYVAFNGDYGIGDFVKIDFTGKNMPLFSFFRDEYSRSAFDGTKGWVVSSGFTNNSGVAIHPMMNNNVRVMGPYMVGKYDEDRADTRSWGGMTGTQEAPYPGSFNSLDDNTRYRVICGFSKLRKGTAGLLNSNPVETVDTLFMTYECLILNLDTQEVFAEFSIETYGIQACRFSEIPLDTENNPHFQGNIVLYGQYGRTTTFDAVYPVITGKTMQEIRNEEVKQANYKETAPSFMKVGETVKVSDFIDTNQKDTVFFYRNAQGDRVDITGETFSITIPGLYTFYYKHDNLFYRELEVFVGDKKYNATVSGDQVVLGAGGIGNGANYAKGDIEAGYVDQAYYALEGTYDLDDYIVLDFTGKNLPEIAFFSQNYSNSMYANGLKKQGIVVVTGITMYNGTLSPINNDCTALNYGFPFMIQDASNGGFCEKAQRPSQLARANLQDGVHYRVIMGFSKYNDNAIDLKWCLYNLDTGEIVEESSMHTWNFFTGSNSQVNNMTIGDLSGEIVLYGKFGVECTIDKIHGVYENTTMEDVKALF